MLLVQFWGLERTLSSSWSICLGSAFLCSHIPSDAQMFSNMFVQGNLNFLPLNFRGSFLGK